VLYTPPGFRDQRTARDSQSVMEMVSASQKTVERLLGELQLGNKAALAELFPLIYDQLRALAKWQRHRWSGDLTLNTTALLHEAYLKLADQKRLDAATRAHFFAIASKAMRHILCNYARDRCRQKRGGGLQRVPLDDLSGLADNLALAPDQVAMLVALDDALVRLGAEDQRLSEVVECRFFGGMSIEDTATALDLSPATVKRQWLLARSWLYQRLQGRSHRDRTI
jgi:RNA polymerase sigma factor (TIGR02999 family)